VGRRGGALDDLGPCPDPAPFRHSKTSPEIIRLAGAPQVWLTPSLRDVEELLHERGDDVSHETTRF